MVLGYQSAKQLAEKGWSVTSFCRRKEAAGASLCEEICQQTGNPHVDYILADLSDLESIKKAVNSISNRRDDF